MGSPSDRRALLTTALGFLPVREDFPEINQLRAWLDSWRGIGDTGLTWQGLNLEQPRCNTSSVSPTRWTRMGRRGRSDG